MQQSVGKMERIKTAIRIVIGLVQVLKDMPKIQKQQDKYPAEWEEFGYFTPSLGLIAPCIPFSYTGLFLTNSFVVPLLLMGCVALAWFFSQRSKRPERGSQEEQEAELQRRSDFYFAFFVCYPSMSQCWFNHFNCRALSTTVSVLMADNGIQCYQDPLWWGLAGIAAVGIVTVSFGVPIVYWIWMHRVMNKHLDAVSRKEKSLIVAYRDFALQFSYIAGAYRPEAFMAESIDLLRKLILAGLVIFVRPGTVVQCFVSCLISFFFVLLHLRMWPYPHFGANMLKLVTEVQICLVLQVSVIFHFQEEELAEDGVGHTFYQRLMLALLAVTSFAFPIALFPVSSAERAQAAIVRLGRKDASELELQSAINERNDVRDDQVGQVDEVDRVDEDQVDQNQLDDGPIQVALTAAQLFREIEVDDSGVVLPRNIIAWFAAHQIPVGRGGINLLEHITQYMAEAGIDGDRAGDEEDFVGLLTELRDMDFQTARDRTRGRDYFVHRVRRTAQWALPEVDEWLAELYAAPARLRHPVDERRGEERTENPAYL